MTSSKKQKKPRGGYAIGYGKPPLHTRSAKGQSGNPGGRPARPQGTSLERARALALEKAYRTVTVKEGGRFVALPAIQAILRRHMALAAKGNGPAQRAVIAAVLAIEEEQASAADQNAREPATETATDMIDAARRISFLLKLAECEKERMAQAAREAPRVAAKCPFCRREGSRRGDSLQRSSHTNSRKGRKFGGFLRIPC